MGSVLIIGPQKVSMGLTKKFKQLGIRSYTATTENYLDTNTITIKTDIFSLSKSNLPQVSIIYYFPNEPSNRKPDPAQYRKSYFHSLNHLLSIIPSSTKVILGSSDHVYGNQYGATADENTPLNIGASDSIPYTILAAENLLQSSPNPHTILRLGYIYSDGSVFLNKMLKSKIGFSQRQHIVNFIHIDDLVSACITLLAKTGTYIVSDYQPTPLNTVLSMISSKTGIAVCPPRKQIPCTRGIRLSPAKLLSLGFTFKHPSFTFSAQTKSHPEPISD